MPGSSSSARRTASCAIDDPVAQDHMAAAAAMAEFAPVLYHVASVHHA
jgi:hypothetical protein